MNIAAVLGRVAEAEGLSAADNDSNHAPVKWKWLERQRRLREMAGRAGEEEGHGVNRRARQARPLEFQPS